MGIVDRLTQEFDLSIEWLGFEIHPETPPRGMPLAQLFPRADVEVMTKRLNSMGEPYRLAFRKIVNISNSRLSLEAGEFAKEQGRFDRFHRAIFEAYFSHGKDIGDIDVLTQLGTQAGLDPDALRNALQTGRYRRVLEEMREEAERLGVTAAPTFFFGKERVIGAQPIEVFRELLRSFR